LYGTRGFGPVSIAGGCCFRPRQATPVPPAGPAQAVTREPKPRRNPGPGHP